MNDEFLLESNRSKEAIEHTYMLLESYVEKSAVELFFESDENSANNTTQTGIIASAKKAIEAVKAMIKKAIESVENFIQTVFLDKAEKARFLAMKEQFKNDPTLAKKKLTVANFRQIEKLNKAALKELDTAIRDSAGQNPDKIAAIERDCMKKVSGILRGAKDTAQVVVTKDVALRLAESNRTTAKLINSMLGDESKAMDYLESQLGETQARDFKNKVNDCTHVLSIHRAKTRLLFQWHKGLVSSTKQVIKDIEDVGTLKPSKLLKHSSMVDDVLGSVSQKTGKTITKRDVVGMVNDTRRNVNDVKRGVNDLRREFNSGVRSAKKGAKDFKKWINS